MRIIPLLLIAIFLVSCARHAGQAGVSGSDRQKLPTVDGLDEFQVAACDGAHKNNNCNLLPDLNLVTAQECCVKLKYCCS